MRDLRDACSEMGRGSLAWVGRGLDGVWRGGPIVVDGVVGLCQDIEREQPQTVLIPTQSHRTCEWASLGCVRNRPVSGRACENGQSMPCIFCRATDNLTDEHVFPAFSGANLVVPNGTCKPCNNKCSKFEQKVAGELETTRHIFHIQDRYGEVPELPVAVEVRSEGAQSVEVRGRMTAEGEIELFDFVSEAKVEDGKKVRHGFFVSASAAERFIERAHKRGETTTELGVPKEVTLQSSAQQTITFAFSYEARQLAAKIALTSLASQYGSEYACHAQFDTLRNIIIGQPQDLTHFGLRIFANEDFSSDHVRTPRQHSVRGYLSAGMHKGWASVTLFGGLSYIIELSRSFDERESRHFSLFYDIELRAKFSPIVRFSEQELLGRVLSPATKFEEPEAVDAQWWPLVEGYCKAKGIEITRTQIAQPGLSQ